MNSYYDTGVFLKLYTAEPESNSVQEFVHAQGERISLTDLHVSESVSALRLKAFRKECGEEESTAAIDLLKNDVRAGIVRIVDVDWQHAWLECRMISEQFAARTGARTLDALHVAVARLLGAKQFLTSDKRQSELAVCMGFPVINPSRKAETACNAETLKT